VIGAFEVDSELVLPGPVLLVDDIVDSRWSLTECTRLLREGGSGAVYPFALADSSRTGD
jgi:ATP-dependent DNA helicase RecQ